MTNNASDEEIVAANADGAKTYPVQCSALRKNGYAILKGKPCKIVDMSTSKTGKHGHAKVNLVGVDIFEGKKYEDMSPSTHNMEVPFVSRKEYQLIDLNEDDGYLTLMADDGEMKEDLHCNNNAELHAEIKAKIDAGEEAMITVLSAMDREIPISLKPVASK